MTVSFYCIYVHLITYGAKLLSADWLRQRAFFSFFVSRGHDYLILIGLKLLSNEVIAKSSCRLKFPATVACRFVEADEEFIEELRKTSETKNQKKKYGLLD